MDHKAYQATRQKQADAVPLTDPEQIANLPWVGNHMSDCVLFTKVELFVKSLDDCEKQRRAIYLMGLHGMGIDEPVTDEELQSFLTD